MIREPVSPEKLEKAIRIWEVMIDGYKGNMKAIKRRYPLTWWARPSYWHNDRGFSKSFKALVQRRIQLQTAIKEQRERENNG